LAIDLSIEKLQEFCSVLNEFALPRAIVDFDRHSFVAWNSKFLEQTGFSEDEMKSASGRSDDDHLEFLNQHFSLGVIQYQRVPPNVDASYLLEASSSALAVTECDMGDGVRGMA
jgi:hypothetical protein